MHTYPFIVQEAQLGSKGAHEGHYDHLLLLALKKLNRSAIYLRPIAHVQLLVSF